MRADHNLGEIGGLGQSRVRFLILARIQKAIPNFIAACLTGAAGPYQGATCADPKVKTKLHPDSYGVQDWEIVAKTVRAASRIMQSAGSISDPRISDRPGRYTDKFRIKKSVNPQLL